MKQAHDDLEQARRIPGFGLDLYAGDDNLIFPFLELGGVGGICVHTHVWGPQTKEMVRRYKDGDVEGARALNDEMAPAFDLLKVADEPDRDQGRAQPARPRGRRLPPADGRPDGAASSSRSAPASSGPAS